MKSHDTAPRVPTRAGRPAALWSDRVWPVLAGAVTAVGLVGAGSTYGPVGLVLVVTGLWCFLALMVYGVLSESGLSPQRAVRASLVATIVLVDLIGLLLLFPLAGWAIAALMGVTCPPVASRATRLVRRARARRTGQTTVDRAFEQIVTELREDHSWGAEGG